MMIDAVFDCACRELAGLPLLFGERVGVRGDSSLDRPEPLTPPLSQPNSGLPEFGTLRWPKSDTSDFGWEREPTEFAAWPAANTASPSHHQHDRPRGLARFDIRMGGGSIPQRIGLADLDLDLAAAHHPEKIVG